MLISTTDDDAIIRYCLPRQTHDGNPALYPQVKMVCQMELTSHLLTAAAFSTMKHLLSPDINDGCNALPGGEMTDLYRHRWETELGYREIKQTMQLSFSESCGMVMRMLMTQQGASPGRIPELMRDIESMAQMVKLPTRRERAFPEW